MALPVIEKINVTKDISFFSNGVGGSGGKGPRLGKHSKSVYKPLVSPPLCERAVCAEFESSPTLEGTGFLEVSRGLTFSILLERV